MDGTDDQLEYSNRTGVQFFSSIGAFFDGTMVGEVGFPCSLDAGTHIVNTAVTEHWGPPGHRRARLHTYVDPVLPDGDKHVHTSTEQDTTWLGGAYDESSIWQNSSWGYDTGAPGTGETSVAEDTGGGRATSSQRSRNHASETRPARSGKGRGRSGNGGPAVV